MLQFLSLFKIITISGTEFLKSDSSKGIFKMNLETNLTENILSQVIVVNNFNFIIVYFFIDSIFNSKIQNKFFTKKKISQIFHN